MDRKGRQGVQFIVSDTDERNFPVNEEDLKRRLAEVAKGLPKQGDNINKFVIPAFILLKDCALYHSRKYRIFKQQIGM